MLKIIPFLMILVLIVFIPDSFGQISIGTPAEHASLTITIEENGDVHVVHLLKKNNQIIQVSLIPGTVENLQVKDVNGKEVQHALSGNELITLFPPKERITVEYDLKDALMFEDGMWTWDYLYTQSESSIFMFPESVKLIYANNRPVNISESEGMRCHGCQMILEYVIDEPVFTHLIEWEGQKFPIKFRTLNEIKSLSFDQPTMRLGFESTGENKFIFLTIPLELLWNPYEVYLDGEKIFKRETLLNSTHVLLEIRPQTSGLVEIIGISAIPEFPVFLPLMLGILMVVGLSVKYRTILR